jgi:hypothetical protein
MTELEQALVRLGGELQFPETPDLAATVRRRLADAQPRRGWSRRPRGRTLVLAFAVLAVAVGAVMAVPPARSAILEFFGLEGATVQRVDTLPALPADISRSLQLGAPVSLDEAGELARFEVLVPELLGEPDGTYHSIVPPGGRISLVYEPREGLPEARETGVGLLVTEYRGDLAPDFIGKMVGEGVSVEPVTVDGESGLWLEGEQHFFFYRNPDGQTAEDTIRLAGNTLLVEQGNLLVRLEGEITRERALEIAAALEPAE